MRAEELKDGLRDGTTLVLSDGVETITSRKRGIAPLVELIQSGRDLSGFVAADKIVGKAAALLYAHMGVREVYAEVGSSSAAEVCERHKIALTCAVMTDRIINRNGDGVCPMEKAVADIHEPRAAYAVIVKKLSELSSK